MKIATYSLLGALVIFKFLDTLFTILIKYKHKAFNELNPIFLITGKTWLMHLYAVFFTAVLIFMFIIIYKKAGVLPRYSIFLIVFLLTIGLIPVVLNNYEKYSLPKDTTNPAVTKQLSTEQLTKIAKMEYEPNVNQFDAKYIFIFCIISFALFQRIEKENEKLQRMD